MVKLNQVIAPADLKGIDKALEAARTNSGWDWSGRKVDIPAIDSEMTAAELQIVADSLYFAKVNRGGTMFPALEKIINVVRRMVERTPTRLIPWNDLHQWECFLGAGVKFYWRGANQRLIKAVDTGERFGGSGNLMAIDEGRDTPSLVYIERVERIVLDQEIIELTREERG